MVRLWINGSECSVPQDLEIEFTFKTDDAEGLDAYCSSYSTAFSLPITDTNITIFTALFDIRTAFGSASFDIHAQAPAILEVGNRSVRGYVKMESIDSHYNLRFINGAGELLEALRTKKLSDLSLVNLPSPSSTWSYNYDSIYGSNTADEYYTFFPAFSDSEEKYQNYMITLDPYGVNTTGAFTYTYIDEDGNQQTGRYELTHIQARNYNVSGLRAAVQMQYIFRQIMTESGFTADYSTDFFDNANTYWKNMHMVLKRLVGSQDNPVSSAAAEWMPDITCEDFILGYCKMFGLRIVINNGTVQFLTRKEWYTITGAPDISSGIDRQVGFKVSPNPYAETIYSCGLELNGGDTATYNRGITDAVNIYDGLPFKYAQMMKYVGPRASWSYDNIYGVYYPTIQDSTVTLPYIETAEGGEILYRFNNYKLEGNGIFLYGDSLNSPYEGISQYKASRKTSAPLISALNDTAPLYAYGNEIIYNYKYKTFTDLQNMYGGWFADYIAEIQDKDNVQVECEAWLDPGTLQQLASCRQVVIVDGTRCRILEMVTNGINHCKLTLQKISNVAALELGQGFSGYYLYGSNNKDKPYIYVPTSSAISDSFDWPVTTNDTIASVAINYDSTYANTYYTATTSGISVKATIPSQKYTDGGSISNAYACRPVGYTLTTASGLSIDVDVVSYTEGYALDYAPLVVYIALNEPSNIYPTLADMPAGLTLRLYDDNNDAWWADTADFTASINQNGVVTVTALTNTQPPVLAAVGVDSNNSTVIYAAIEPRIAS